MALEAAVLNAAADGATAVLDEGSIHTADPGGTGASEVTGGGYARQAITWGAAAAGVATASGTLAFSGPAAGAALYFGSWSTGGTWRGGVAMTGDTAFNASGEFNVTTLTLTAANG